jgi:hypothetical protein
VEEEDVDIEDVIDDVCEDDIEDAEELDVVDSAEEVEVVEGRVTDEEDVEVFPDREITAPTPAMIITIITITTATTLLMPDLLSFI